MTKQETNRSGFYNNIKERLPGRFVDHGFPSPQHRSREMQSLVFADARKITEEEREELINTVKDMHEGLIENGRFDRDYLGIHCPAHFLEDLSDSNEEYSVMVVPPIPQGEAHKNPRPKFSLKLSDAEGLAVFNLYDETYNLEVDVRGAVYLYAIDQLSLSDMTKPEHDFVMGCIGKVSSHFGIPLR